MRSRGERVPGPARELRGAACLRLLGRTRIPPPSGSAFCMSRWRRAGTDRWCPCSRMGGWWLSALGGRNQRGRIEFRGEDRAAFEAGEDPGGPGLAPVGGGAAVVAAVIEPTVESVPQVAVNYPGPSAGRRYPPRTHARRGVRGRARSGPWRRSSAGSRRARGFGAGRAVHPLRRAPGGWVPIGTRWEGGLNGGSVRSTQAALPMARRWKSRHEPIAATGRFEHRGCGGGDAALYVGGVICIPFWRKRSPCSRCSSVRDGRPSGGTPMSSAGWKTAAASPWMRPHGSGYRVSLPFAVVARATRGASLPRRYAGPECGRFRTA